MSDKDERDPVVLEGELVEEPPAATPVGDYDEAGVPSFDYVRDRIEGRFATSAGATELPEESARAASLDEQMERRDKAAAEKLEQIRRSLRAD
jgi:phage shock protein A